MAGMSQAAGMRIALVGIGKIALDQHVLVADAFTLGRRETAAAFEF